MSDTTNPEPDPEVEAMKARLAQLDEQLRERGSRLDELAWTKLSEERLALVRFLRELEGEPPPA